MSEAVAPKKEEPKKKGVLGKLKDTMDDKDEQIAILSTFVRLLPPALGVPEQKLDPTFIASVFTGVLATFGVQAAKDKGGGGNGSSGISKDDLERLIEKASQTAPSQTIRLESTPIKLTGEKL